MPVLEFATPTWLDDVVEPDRRYRSVEDRMGLAIAIARANVEHDSGGPFGAAVFEERSGALVSVGMNQVLAGRSSMLHAEIIALILAQTRARSHTLASDGLPRHQLVSSSDPCAMCLGAAAWSGIRSLVTGALLDDALAIGFDEGPVDAGSFRYLADRGIAVTRGVLRPKAREVLQLYRDRGGTIYGN